MTLHRKLFLLGMAAALAGCASVPTQYLTLSSPSPVAARQSLQGHGLPIVVAHVQMPADIDRLYLTTLQGKHRLDVAGHVRWAAPLGGMAQKVLAQDLASALPDKTVLMPGDPIPNGPYLLVKINVQSFIPSDDGKVFLQADWFISRMPDGHLQTQGRSHFYRGNIPSSPTAQAAAMSQLLERLSGELAHHLG